MFEPAKGLRPTILGYTAPTSTVRTELYLNGNPSWIGNEDRTPKNLLFQAPREFLPIDHGEALPSGMRPDSRYRNALARHLLAEERDSPQALAAQVRKEMADFADIDFNQILMAGLPEGWNANPEFTEWCGVLKERLRHLPDLVEAEFKTGQGSTILEFQSV